jgi:hypothetical protein
MAGTFDRKLRLAREIARERGWDPVTVSGWLLVADGRTNRRHVAAHATFLRSRFPADGHAMRNWLRRPSGSIHAVSFLSSARSTSAGQRLTPVRRVRVRRASTRAEGA